MIKIFAIVILAISLLPISSVQAASKPAKPVITVKNSDKGPQISWQKVDNADGYRVYRKTDDTAKYKSVKTTTKLSFTDTKCKAASGDKVLYKVRAYYVDKTTNKKVWGSYSSVVTITISHNKDEKKDDKKDEKKDEKKDNKGTKGKSNYEGSVSKALAPRKVSSNKHDGVEMNKDGTGLAENNTYYLNQDCTWEILGNEETTLEVFDSTKESMKEYAEVIWDDNFENRLASNVEIVSRRNFDGKNCYAIYVPYLGMTSRYIDENLADKLVKIVKSSGWDECQKLGRKMVDDGATSWTKLNNNGVKYMWLVDEEGSYFIDELNDGGMLLITFD